MESTTEAKPETCPRCGRQRVWALWRKCECGYDFGPEVPAGYSAEPEESKPDSPRVISHLERSAMLVLSWMGLCAIWALNFYGYNLLVFIGMLFWLLRVYSEDYRIGVPQWMKLAACGTGGLFVLVLFLLIWFDVPDRPEKLAVAPPFHRFLRQVFPLTAIPLLVVAGYYVFLIITRRVTQAEPEKT